MPDSRLSHDGNLDGTPGAALTFPHVFTAGSRGSLRLSSSAASSPPAQNWSDALYQDANCNGQIDADTDALIDPKQAFELDAGQNLCLVHKQFIPTDAATGHRISSRYARNWPMPMPRLRSAPSRARTGPRSRNPARWNW